jgi:hypothetical protein
VNCESVVAAYQDGTRRSTSLFHPFLRGPIIEDVRSTRETIRSAVDQSLIDEDRKPVHVRLLPGLSKDELDDFVLSLPVPPSADIRDLLAFCSGIKTVCSRLGHSKASFTLAQYCHLMPGQDQEAAVRTDARMRKSIEQVRQPKVI